MYIQYIIYPLCLLPKALIRSQNVLPHKCGVQMLFRYEIVWELDFSYATHTYTPNKVIVSNLLSYLPNLSIMYTNFICVI